MVIHKHKKESIHKSNSLKKNQKNKIKNSLIKNLKRPKIKSKCIKSNQIHNLPPDSVNNQFMDRQLPL